MNFGWIQQRTFGTQPHEPAILRDLVAQSDALGFNQLSAPGFTQSALESIPETKQLRLAMSLSDLSRLSNDALAHMIERRMQRIVVELEANELHATELLNQVLDSAFQQTYQSGTEETKQGPECLVAASKTLIPYARTAAQMGHGVLATPWQTHSELARQWTEIVSGATHAGRRAKRSSWHISRYVFISDDAQAIRDFEALAKTAQEPVFASQKVSTIIAGSVDSVVTQITELIQTVGHFGGFHCVDPGLGPALSRQQRERFMTQVMPQLTLPSVSQKKVLEKI